MTRQRRRSGDVRTVEGILCFVESGLVGEAPWEDPRQWSETRRAGVMALGVSYRVKA